MAWKQSGAEFSFTEQRLAPVEVEQFSIHIYDSPATERDMICAGMRTHAHTYGEDRLMFVYDSLAALEADLRRLGIQNTTPIREEWQKADERYRECHGSGNRETMSDANANV